MTHTIHRISYLIRAATLAGGVSLSSTLPAQTSAWFPLQVGNEWLYRQAPSNSSRGEKQYRSISVHGKETISGREYFEVSYFGREVLLRAEAADNSVVLYDRISHSEQPWVSPGLPAGATFPTGINPCPTTALIAAREATLTTPTGTYEGAVQVNFQGNCVDVGVTRQFYAPSIGLVSSEETSFGGPVKFELSYYRAGSGTVAAQEVSFTVATDTPVYPVGGTLEARLTLRTSSADPIRLNFPGGQSFDLKILDDQGNVVYLWSKGRAFTLVIRDETFGPGEKTYGLSAPLTGLPPGRYTAEAYLTTSPLLYRGEVSFEIAPILTPLAVVKRGVGGVFKR